MGPTLVIIAAWLGANALLALGFGFGAALGYRRGMEEGRDAEPERVVSLEDPPARRACVTAHGTVRRRP
jgi:hypothetical protein